MRKITVEICCGSVDDVIQAKKAGADRVELNSCLFLGGLTPSIGEVRGAKKIGLDIMAMVRPRGGGFCYTDAEFETMLVDTEVLIAEGVEGIVFGILNPDGSLDENRCAKIMEIIGDRISVFHRAIDVAPDWKGILDGLIRLGVNRVLTSGQQPTVHYGADTVRGMLEYARGRIEILAGGGYNRMNIRDVVEKTGVDQIHLSAFKSYSDTSADANPNISFGGALYPPENSYKISDGEVLRSLIGLLNP